MIRKLEDNFWRITKDCDPFLLLIFYQSITPLVRLKILETRSIHEQPRHCYFKDLTFDQMPPLIKFNFNNLAEIFEEIRITSKDCFHFDRGANALKISLQIGSKLKHCVFHL